MPDRLVVVAADRERRRREAVGMGLERQQDLAHEIEVAFHRAPIV